MLAPDIRQTYQQAIERDLESIDAHLAYKNPVIHSGVFHCQQAVEKILKLLLACAAIDYPRTHNLEKLVDLLPPEHSFKSRFGDFLGWTEYAVMPRYDFEMDVESVDLPSLEELKEWRKMLDELYKNTKEFLHAKP